MSNLSKYGRSAIDKTFPDKEETVFGHMVLELGMSPIDASQALRPWVKDYSQATDRAKSWGYRLGVLGIAGGVVLAATVGIGIPAIAPLAVGIYNVFSARSSAEEHSTREAEFLILKECPELLKLLYALGKRGMLKEVIVECYDSLVFSFMGQFSLHSQNGQLSGFDVSKQDIVGLFEELIREKMSMETGAKEILVDFEAMNFDTLYQSEPSQVQKQLPIGENTRLGAVEVPIVPEISEANSEGQAQPASSTPLPRQQITQLPLAERANYLMSLLAEDGCDLRKLSGRPTLAAGGLQRSGKTTLIAMLAILEKAMGQQVFYISRDSDLYPIAFDGYAGHVLDLWNQE